MSYCIFDLDGTLTDNFTGISRSLNYALQKLGRPPILDAELNPYIGPPLRSTLSVLLGSENKALLETALQAYRERYDSCGWQENKLYPSITELLSALVENGRRLFVCTVKPQAYAERILEHFKLAGYFLSIYGADFTNRYDDKTILLNRLLEEQDLPRHATVMIGDREHDIQAARSNAIDSIGVLWGYGTRDELIASGATRLCSSAQQLRSLLLHNDFSL